MTPQQEAAEAWREFSDTMPRPFNFRSGIEAYKASINRELKKRVLMIEKTIPQNKYALAEQKGMLLEIGEMLDLLDTVKPL